MLSSSPAKSHIWDKQCDILTDVQGSLSKELPAIPADKDNFAVLPLHLAISSFGVFPYTTAMVKRTASKLSNSYEENTKSNPINGEKEEFLWQAMLHLLKSEEYIHYASFLKGRIFISFSIDSFEQFISQNIRKERFGENCISLP